MIKAKITKNDGKWVYLMTDSGSPLVAKRLDIDFGILVGDSVFVDSQQGVLLFKRVEKDDLSEKSAPHFFDSQWGERESEYKSNVAGQHDSLVKDLEKEIIEIDKKTDETIDTAIKEVKSSIFVYIVIIVLVVILIGFITSL